MAFSINDIRAQLALGGARPALFMVSFTNPITAIADLKTPFLARASQLPAWHLSNIPVGYFGRKMNVAGTRTFDPWTITVYNDEDFLIRNAMETWSNAINSLEGNLNTTGSSAPANYKSQGTVTQFGKDGSTLRVYQFNGIFPTEVTAIDLDWNNGDQMEEFQMTLMYDDFVIQGGSTGNAGGN